MERINLVAELSNTDKRAIQLIKDLFKRAGITELDVSNDDHDNDNLCVYCFDDDCHSADNIKINKIVLDDDTLVFIDDTGLSHSSLDFHIGSMPYVYNAVYDLIGNVAPTQDVHTVYIYYHGCYSTTVTASNEDEALEMVREEIEKLSDLDFLDAISLIEDGNDVYKGMA